MSAPIWWGGATAVAQIWKGTITTHANGDTYKLTLTDDAGNTVLIQYAAVSADSTATLVATGLITAWAASTDPRITAITASQSGAQVILTANTSGAPFTVSATA